MNNYIIQTRNKDNLRNARVSIDMIQGTDPKNWTNYDWYKSKEKADENAMSLIKYGQYKASDVRVVQVVSTFKSTVNVEVETDG